VTEGTAVVWMVRVAMAMHWAEVRAKQREAVETEVGAMVADWGEVAMAAGLEVANVGAVMAVEARVEAVMAAGTAVAVMGVAMAARMVARADNGQWPSAPRLSGACCQRHTSSRSIASSGLNRSQRVA
jgi:hypothetical protein